MRRFVCIIFIALVSMVTPLHAQKKTGDEPKLTPEALGSLSWRSIGPAFMSGRIADIVIDPRREHTWYVAVGSGGIWKTTNGGTTFTPVFDKQTSYSIGCLALDPSNPNTVWAGTGENVGGRHVGYGDGIYRSTNAGASWTNLGLKASEHISKIIIHPSDSNTVWVAAQGPLWSKGGERGVYKTTDGGSTWKRVLGDADWVGATDLLIDPRDPNVLHAATWQRHRTVAGYIGGGPGTAIYTSTDGGTTWNKRTAGLPSGNLGKIGLALSPQQPDVLYAAIELDRRGGAVYRSENRGEQWTKMSDAVSGGTGPHYYQELYADPHRFDRIYLVDNHMQISNDGGKTFVRMNEGNKHIDNHAIAFKASDPDYLLVGTDGGLYETLDLTKTWRYLGNMPITQFYKIAVDDTEPFYMVYGGTQDNATQGGPSRTDNVHGIANHDWFVTVFGDGHQPATEPGNPNIVYSQWQQGNLVRHDRLTGEIVYIQPVPAPNEAAERWNWDSPILVSPHNPARLYFASQRVWRSENRGDAWRPISPDLSKGEERVRTPFYGALQGWDHAWDIYAMSQYGSITSLAESPVVEGLLYAGTDDGTIAVSEDGGANWRSLAVSRLPGVPASAFVNDIKADLFDANTVYVALDNHKNGDYTPYLFKSTDRGRTWVSLASSLPDRHLCWRLVQDHVASNLLFLGTEFGAFVSVNGGQDWVSLSGGMPVIAVRDLAIQRRENDLVAGTFGRGIYILDDYSVLRSTAQWLSAEASLYAPGKAHWYVPRNNMGVSGKGFQGDPYYVAENPPVGATFTYSLKNIPESRTAQRQANEKKLKEAGKPVTFPEWEALDQELNELKPALWLVVADAKGNIVNRVSAPLAKGLQRVTWDFRKSSPAVVSSTEGDRNSQGALAVPGKYTAQLVIERDGLHTPVTDAVSFEVTSLRKGALPGREPAELDDWFTKIEQLQADAQQMEQHYRETLDRAERMRRAFDRAPSTDAELLIDLIGLRDELLAWSARLNGSTARAQLRENGATPTLGDYLQNISMGSYGNTYGATDTHRTSYTYAEALYRKLRSDLEAIMQQVPEYERRLTTLGAPPVKGQGMRD